MTTSLMGIFIPKTQTKQPLITEYLHLHEITIIQLHRCVALNLKNEHLFLFVIQ